ncbi:MAG: alpha-isopropylmalate synthase regulatory domain-containing protein [Cyanobacteria bacterium P01_D01_bin.56]
MIPNLQLKKGYQCISPSQLSMLAESHNFVSETFNLAPNDYAPYVGRSAFAHKGGVHISAVERNPQTYEHIPPSLVGNSRQIVVSNVSGTSTVRARARHYGINLTEEQILAIVQELKELEGKGYQFEAAEASFELLMLTKHNSYQPKFHLKDHRVSYDALPTENIWHTRIQSTVKVSVGNQEVLEVAEGIGPVSAFDKALRRALVQTFPEIKNFQLTDYKVRLLNSEVGTAANIRVLVEFSDGGQWWSTIGVSKNLLEASYEAVTAGIEYGLRLPDSVK